MPITPGALPQSQALSEASPDSLAELFNRDPEGYTERDLDRMIDALRAQRARWALAEAQGPKTRPQSANAASKLVGHVAPEDLGL